MFTVEVIRKIEEVAALDGSIEEMAYYAGIERTTLYKKLEKDEAFFNKIEALRTRPILKARQTVVGALGDPNHAFKYLEKKRRKEFGDSIDITTKGHSIAGVEDRVNSILNDRPRKV